MFTVAAAVMIALALGIEGWNLAKRVPLRLERELPERAWLGRADDFVLKVHNGSPLPVRVDVYEELPADLGTPEPRASLRIAAREVAALAIPFLPTVRGNRQLGVPVVLEAGLFGLVQRRCEGNATDAIRVYPDTRGFLGKDALDPRHLRATLGIRPARRRGDGSEFDSLREYVPGDDPRRLDWAASARRGKPVVRQFRHERNHTVVVAVDSSRLMASREEETGGRTKLDFAIDAALTLSHAAVASGDRVGLSVFDREVRAHLAPRRARRDLGEFIELLTDIHPRIVEGDLGALTRDLATKQKARALVVVLTDFVETETASFLGPLAVLGRQHRVLLVAIRDRVFRTLDPATDKRMELDPFRRMVVDDLLSEREAALLTLRRRGLQTLDLPPQQITGAVLNRYLAMREAR